MNNVNRFTVAVSTIRSALARRARKEGVISAVDVADVAPTVSGSTRGAAVRAAFVQLVKERILRPTTRTKYNPDTRHSVVVYKTV